MNDLLVCGNCGYEYGPQSYGEDYDMHQSICPMVKARETYKSNLKLIRGRGKCMRCGKECINKSGLRHLGSTSEWCDDTTIQSVWKVSQK